MGLARSVMKPCQARMVTANRLDNEILLAIGNATEAL